MPREDKSKSARSPPPGSSPAKKAFGKQSKAGRKEVVEREKAERGRNNEEFICCTKKLIEILSDGGVSEPYLEGLRTCFAIKADVDDGTRDESNKQLIDDMNYLVQADNAVENIWSFASCYPSIDVNALIVTLHDLRSLLCARANLVNKHFQRKLGDVRSDSKADQSSLDAMEVYEKQAIGKSKSILDLDYSMSSLASQ